MPPPPLNHSPTKKVKTWPNQAAQAAAAASARTIGDMGQPTKRESDEADGGGSNKKQIIN